MFPALPAQAAPTSGRWTDAASFHAAAMREAYLAEIGRLAAGHRSRFESGELRAFRDEDDEEVFRPGGTGEADSPHWEVERLCAAHFGLEVKRSETRSGGETFDGNVGAAHLVLACSPHAESTEDAFFHPCYHAQTSAAWDLIAYARAAGWYVPRADETEDPLFGWCDECDHGLEHHGDGVHNKAGCRVHECECAVRHTPHVPGVLA
jgi:hypothetical protein